LADTKAFVAQLNAQGTRGYRFVTSMVVGKEVGNFYARDDGSTSEWKAEAAPTNSTALRQQLETQGAMGYRYVSTYRVGSSVSNLYVKDAGNTAILLYSLEKEASNSVGILAQANGKGSGAYMMRNTLALSDGTFTMYEYDSSRSSARYAYKLEAAQDTMAKDLAQYNAQGQTGYRFLLPVVTGDGQFNLYARDASQSSRFDWEAQSDTATTLDELTQQANDQGAKSYRYVGGLAYGKANVYNIYVKPNNCAGLLCRSGMSGLLL